MNNSIEVVPYVPGVHKVEGFVLEQHISVESGMCQMLPLPYEDGKLSFEHELPYFVAVVGDVALAGAGFNAQYQEHTVELGGAYVMNYVRGQGLYHKLTGARISFARLHNLSMMSFANSSSHPILTQDFGLEPVSAQTAPQEAFDLCVSCNKNQKPGCPASFETCCYKDSILYLPQSKVE